MTQLHPAERDRVTELQVIMALIELRNIEKVYRDEATTTHALRGVSFSIHQGEFVAIMGPSGSGKSTLLHVLGLLDTATAGAYKFEGKLSGDYTPHQIAQVRNERMGFVFQMFNLLPRTSVVDNVMLPLVYSKIPQSEWHTRSMKAITAVGLKHRLQHISAELSGGERQRVAIARALVMNPAVIFADEPTGNLDSVSGTHVMELLQSLHRKGHTIILITHDPGIATYAHRLITLRDGKMENDVRMTK